MQLVASGYGTYNAINARRKNAVERKYARGSRENTHKRPKLGRRSMARSFSDASSCAFSTSRTLLVFSRKLKLRGPPRVSLYRGAFRAAALYQVYTCGGVAPTSGGDKVTPRNCFSGMRRRTFTDKPRARPPFLHHFSSSRLILPSVY